MNKATEVQLLCIAAVSVFTVLGESQIFFLSTSVFICIFFFLETILYCYVNISKPEKISLTASVYIHCTSLQRFLYSEFIDHRFPQPNIEQEAARKEQMDQCKEQENETKLQNYNPQLAALFVFIAYGESH